MSYTGSIKVTTRAGWFKTIDLEKSLCLIGSGRASDVLLPEEYGSGVLPLHLQLVAPRAGASGAPAPYRLINLTDYEYPLYDAMQVQRGTLTPRSTCELQDGSILQLGDFTLQFQLIVRSGISIEKRTENIGMRLDLPRKDLEPGKAIAGLLTLVNFGEQKRCQFSLELEGLPQACFQIAPAPLLYPGAAEELSIRFFHRGTQPPAGALPVQIRATAPGSYPSESITLSLALQVAPLHQFSLTILDDPQKRSSQEAPANGPAQEQSAAAAAPLPGPTQAAAAVSDRVKSEPPPQAALPSATGSAQPQPAETTPLASAALEGRTANTTLAAAPALQEAPIQAATMPQAEPAAATAAVQDTAPEETLPPEQSWWSEPEPLPPSPFQPDRPNSLKKDIKSRLAGKDIQVIKAGLETEEDDKETR